jgi:hypothetical protein
MLLRRTAHGGHDDVATESAVKLQRLAAVTDFRNANTRTILAAAS